MIRHKKPLFSKGKKTYIAFVLDKSGSMGPFRNSVIESFNEQLQEHKNNSDKGGETYFSLIQFSGDIEEIFFNIPIDEIEGELDRNQYNPSGTTALYDAIGYTVKKLQRYDKNGDVGFLVIILSDGKEVSSTKYSWKTVQNLKEELEKTERWTFQYIGCDPEALEEVTSKLKINTFQYDNSESGWKNLTAQVRSCTAEYYKARSDGQTSVGNFMQKTS